eukprot:TRINITY_DN35507_c0_g3_i1.p2 TRINITY_DN35507_c0_g3~~TRINITY_DN35507_c0_g3_i1.p2  ORF type:complete len:189 (-),score=15.88 TRINITY_DN35507_c0_g3_i1:858-1424(-)
MNTSMNMYSMGMPTSMPITFQATIQTELWITGWKIETGGQYFGTLIVLFLLTLILEFIGFKRHEYVKKFFEYKQQRKILVDDFQQQHGKSRLLKENQDLLRLQAQLRKTQGWTYLGILTCLYALNVSISFLLMLAVMSYNVGFFVIIVVGMSIGHFISMAYTNYDEQKFTQAVEMSADLCCAAPLYAD